jgi:hypothetical protein
MLSQHQFHLDYNKYVIKDVSGNQWIIAHRGEWGAFEEQNSHVAFQKALQHGFGIETDIRHHENHLIVSHDVVTDFQNILSFELELQGRYDLNIKEDGLGAHFAELRDGIENTNSFLFDGSVPQMYLIRKLVLPHALRLSEYESEIPWEPTYIWVDGFESDWWLANSEIMAKLDNYHLVFVSPELHGRSHHVAFDWFANLKVNHKRAFSVCTDFPSELLELCGE